MKWLINLISLRPLLYIALRLCILKLLIHNVLAYNNKAPPPIVRHPGTCTFQQLQDACTFSLLCYLAGGIPIEGCGTGSSTTCCVLQHNPSVQQALDISKLTNANDHGERLADKSANLAQDTAIPPTNLPPSSTTYADTEQPPPVQTNGQLASDSALAISKNSPEKESSSTESSLRNRLAVDSNSKYTNEDATLHSSSSSLSASTNAYESPYAGYQTHHQIHHSPRSLYPPPISHPSSLQYHHRLQHPYSSIANPHHLNHQKQHQHNLYLHQQRLASHPSLNHPSSLYSSAAYHHPSAHRHYSPVPPSYHPAPSSNARSFHLTRYNNPLLSQYQSNYLLSDSLNYYGAEPSGPSSGGPGYGGSSSPGGFYGSSGDGYRSVPEQRPSSPYSEHLSGYGLNDQADTSAYSSPLSDLSMPTGGSVVSSSNAYGNGEPDSPPPYLNNLNDYSNPSPTHLPPGVPSSSSLLSSYAPTQTIDYKTYQKHSVNPYNAAADLQFPPLHSTSSSTSSYESTTNHSNHHHLFNSNKIYAPAAVESPASIKYYNTHLAKNADYEPSTSYNANAQPDDAPVNSISSDEESPLMIDHNSRLSPEEDEYNSNAIRRSRLASPLNSIAIERQAQARNFIGEDGCGKPISKPTKRIIGGQDAYYAEFPWMAHVKIAKQQCGGTLINRDFVATAAHCVYQAPLEQLTIIIGAHDIESKNSKYYDEIPQHHEVESVILHPNFRFSAAHPDRFDIALLKLKRRAVYSNTVRPICLPPKNLNNIEGWRGVVTGWGKTESSLANRYGTRLLQKVDVPIINNQECEKWHQTRGIDLKIFSEMMCAGYEDGQKDACVGDSGGPLIVFLNNRWVLAGITSAGFGCAQAQQPGIYHRVSYTVDWIQQILNGSPYR